MDDARTVFCGNLSEMVTEELLYELFLQAAPLERVRIPTDREGRKSNFAFITFKHGVSVNYALQLLNGVRLFDKSISVKPRNNQNQPTERYTNRNEYQNTLNPTAEILMGQIAQYNHNYLANSFSDAWQEHNNFHERDRHRENHKGYKKHDYHDSRHDSPNRRRNNYPDRRNTFKDRNNRRNNSRHYY